MELKKLAENFDIAGVMIDVDHADVRKYIDERFFLQVEAMLENIEAKGTKR